MDGASTIGLLAAILQFVDVGQKFLSHCVELYQSSEGTLKEYDALGKVTEDFALLNKKLQNTSVTTSDEALRRLCESCAVTAKELLAGLNRIKTTAKHSKRESIKAAFRSVWSKKDIEHLAKRLADFRQELIIHVTVDVWFVFLFSSGYIDKPDTGKPWLGNKLPN